MKKEKKNNNIPLIIVIFFLSIIIWIITANIGASKECEEIAKDIYGDKDVSCSYLNDATELPCKCRIFSCRQTICDEYEDFAFRIKKVNEG